MVRLARTHLSFVGTCERLLHQRQPRQLERLLQHVVITSYPEVAATEATGEARLLAFYGELVESVARLSAEWMAAGFTHGVLNTDNMSLAGESFDYGPFAFLDRWDPLFTAAYFDHAGLYAYGQQPAVAHQNLLLQEPLAMLLPRAGLEARLERFAPAQGHHYRQLMARRLGLPTGLPGEEVGQGDAPDPVPATLQLLAAWPVGYGAFFTGLAGRVAETDLPATPDELVPFMAGAPEPPRQPWLAWRDAWWACSHQAANTNAPSASADRLQRWNLPETPVRPMIERLWEAIDQADDWQPFHDWLARTVMQDD